MRLLFMKNLIPIVILIAATLMFSGCKKDDGGGATDAMAPSPGGASAGMASAPGGMASPSMPSMPGMGGSPMMGGGMGGSMPGSTAGAPAASAPVVKKDETPLPEDNIPDDAIIEKDKNGEIRSYKAPSVASARVSRTPFGKGEMECRQNALAFVRKNYSYFDSMDFSHRDQPGKWKGDRWEYTWYQLIRDTKRTGNFITISINPENGEVVSYKSVKMNWTN